MKSIELARALAAAMSLRLPGTVGKIAAVQPDGHCDLGSGHGAKLVPRRGLEPPRLAALVPETSASTNSATWALRGLGTEQALRCQMGALYSIKSILYSANEGF